LILDVGANIGMFSLFAGERCGGDARIVSFEPIPSTHSVLQANAELALARSGGKVRIQALNVGLSSHPAAVTFEHHPHFTVWSTNDAAFAEARLARIIDDMPRALDTNPSWLVRACFPRALARALAALVLRRKVGVTQRVPVRLSTLSTTLDDLGLGGEDIDFLKVDVDECKDLSQQFGVQSMPTFKLLRGGKEVGEMKGADEGALREKVEGLAGPADRWSSAGSGKTLR
jgi:FkbM family methyltransferase